MSQERKKISRPSEKSREQLLQELAELRAMLATIKGRPELPPRELDRLESHAPPATGQSRYNVLEFLQEGFALTEIVRDDSGSPCDFLFLKINAVFARMIGFAPEAACGKTLLQLFPNADPGWTEMFRRAALSGKPIETDKYSPTLNKWFSVRIFSPEAGKLAGLFIDISARKRAEEALRESREQLERAQKMGHLGSWELDLVGDRLICSDELYRILGLPPQAEGFSYAAFRARVHPHDRAALDAAYNDSLHANREGYEIEHRVVRKDTAEIRFVHEKCEHFRDASGRIVRSFGMVLDITELKRTERELRRSSQFPEENPNPVLRCSGSGSILFINSPARQWLRTLGWSAGGPLPPPLFEAVAEAHMLDHGVETEITNPAGRTFGVFVVRPPDEDYINLYGVDLTERERVEKELLRLNETLEQRVAERTELAETRARQLQALVSELTLAEQRERRRLAQILHDHQQQLLVAAKFNCEILAGRIDADHKQVVEKIKALIVQSVETSRSLTAELAPPYLQQGHLSSALKWLAAWMKENHGLAIDLKISAGLNPIREDIGVILFQSIRELLFNVVKHAGAKSARLEIARIDNRRIWVTVSDQGSGFDPETIWDMSKAGTKFGLFSIRERLALFGGSMAVESSRGNGAAFSLIVPL